MPPWFLRWFPLLLVTATALWLRTRDLAVRPMHADEANQAVKAGELIETGRYAFDPRDHHGPVLYYAARPVAFFRGQKNLAQLDETTVRLVPALAGTVAVLLLGLLATPLGRGPALVAAAFLAVSPPAVYYSRYFVQETLLATFTLALFLSAHRWWTTGRARWAMIAGVCTGLMQATKASAPFFVFAGLLALLVVPPSGGTTNPGPIRRTARDGALALLAALVTAALFYSSFGANLPGLRDALGTYTESTARLTSGATGHEKPWWYFLQLLTWQRAGGLVFEQATFTALALAGAVIAFAARIPLLRWAAGYTALVLVGLSLPAYKTPWHAIHLVPGMALLAAGALGELARFRVGRFVAVAAAIVVLADLFWQTERVTRTYAADARNPYAYVHSSPDVRKFRALADSARAASPGRPIRVISEEYWPLPWYFRGLDNVGYWTRVPEDCDGALVVASASLAAEVRARLHGSYREDYLGLRPGFVCIVFTFEP